MSFIEKYYTTLLTHVFFRVDDAFDDIIKNRLRGEKAVIYSHIFTYLCIKMTLMTYIL